jgi:hypothetical protein
MKRAGYILLPLIFFSCAKDKVTPANFRPEGCDSMQFTFADILPILNANCNFGECHSPGGEGSYDLSDYDVVAWQAGTGNLGYRIDLPPDDPQHMPEDMLLSACDYYKIKTWIHQGYPE